MKACPAKLSYMPLVYFYLFHSSWLYVVVVFFFRPTSMSVWVIHVWQAVNVPILSMTLSVHVYLEELEEFVRYVIGSMF